LQWLILRDGKQVAAVPARASDSYEHADKTPGKYEVVLQIWKYVDYQKRNSKDFVNSKYIDVSNPVSYIV
jgi:hypothetical protein